MTDKPATHLLKTWPELFAAVRQGLKTYEIRKADRPFNVGDRLWLCEFDPKTAQFSGESEFRRITYMTPGGEWGLPHDLCVLGLGPTLRESTR